MKQTEKAGYHYLLCVRCDNGYQTVDKDNWVVSQCGEFKAGSITEIIQGYQSLDPESTTEFSSLFLSSDSNCAVQDCTLLEPGCVDPKVLDGSTHIIIEESPAQLKVKYGNGGFDYTVCLRCSNGVETKTIDNFFIKTC